MKLPEIYQTKLLSVAHEIENKNLEEMDISVASLTGLKQLLGKDDIKDNPNFAYYAGDLAAGSFINKNHDGITIADAVKIYKKFEGTPIDVEHVTAKVVGYIVKANLTDPDTKEILTEEQALAYDKPINISIAFVVWNRVDATLANILEEVSDEGNISHGLISLSWELAFDEYVVLVGSKNVFEGNIVEDDAEIEKIEGSLRCNKGTGFLPDGTTPVYRLVTGSNLMPLGAGLVVKPAADVKGIVKIEEEIDNSNANDQTSINPNNFLLNNSSLSNELKDVDIKFEKAIEELKANVSVLTDKIEKSSLSNDDTVRPFRMKIKNISDINDETLKVIEASELTRFIASELEKKTDEHQKEIEAKDAEAALVKATADEAVAKALEASEKLEQITKELDEIKAARLAEKAESDFNIRMAALDEEFELSDDDRRVVASQIKSLDEEVFASWKTSFDIIAKEKGKEFIKFKKGEADKEKAENEKSSEDNKEEEKMEGKKCAASETVLDTIKANEATVPSSMSFGEDAIAGYREAFSLTKGVTFTK